MLPPEFNPDWLDVFEICRRISADSAAWDETNAFIEALNELSQEKRASRQSHQLDLAKELPEFLERWKPLIGSILPPGAGTWATAVADEVQAELARKALRTLDTALVEADTAARALDQAPYGERRALRVRQAEAQDRIEAASDELISLLGGENPSAVVEPSPHPVDTTEPLLTSDGKPPILPPPEEKPFAVPLLLEAAASSHEEPPSSTPIRPVSEPVVSPMAVPKPPAVDAHQIAPSAADIQLPPELDGYDAFRTRHWIEPDGRCAVAPWEDAGFETRVHQAAEKALQRQDFASLWIYSQTAQERAFVPLVEPEDVRHLASLWNEPNLLTAALSATRAVNLRHAVERGEGTEGRWQMAAFLEALHPSLEDPLNPDVLSGITFENALLNSTAIALLRLNLGDGHPVERLRDEQTKVRKPSVGELAAQLVQARQELQKLVAQQHSAAGGRIKLTHCRQAWTRFMKEAVQPLARRLQPSGSPNDHKSWDLEDLRRQVVSLAERHDRIADQANADYEVRHVMDRAANEIVQAMLSVIQLTGALRPNSVNLPRSNADLAALRPLLECAAMDDPVAETCRLLFLRIVRSPQPLTEDGTVPLALPTEEVIMRPWLASVFGRSPLAADGQLPARLPRDLIALRDAPRAAAALLSEPILRREELPADRRNWLAALRDALTRVNRRDLRACFVSAEFIAEPEKTLIQTEQAEAQGALESRLQELRSQWREAEALVLPFEAKLKTLLDDGERQIEDAAPLQREIPLFDSWLRALGDFLRQTIDGQCARFLAEADSLGKEVLERVKAAIETRRFADVLGFLQGRPAAEALGTRDVRETLWREEAVVRWPKPLGVLEQAREDGADEEGPESNLLRLWCTHPTDANVKRRLRAAFHEFLAGGTKRPREGSSTNLTYHNEPSRFRVEVPLLLGWLNARGFNPTFVPQLHGFSEVVFMSPPVSQSNAQDFAKALLNAVPTKTEGQPLTVFLAPRLSRSPEARVQTISQIRQRSRHVALLDDLDLCRLLAPSGRQPNGFVGLLEIVFEQMDWTHLQPFNTQDGQFVQAEMFVGRDVQAEELANTMTYSRVFSGRKLGKSALLKHLEMSRNGRKLPSGQNLRVAYLNAAGAAKEPSLVDKILERLTEALDFRFPAPPKASGSSERLAHALKAWWATMKGDSLLVILDEADSFVEEQIAGYALATERSLSFAMMKAIPDEAKDSRGLPRVRFLLAGYRATNRDDGVWANAGQVLRLEPLREEEAVRLIEGPLARLNIDVREQAPAIARRCGNQPAVLLRFGETLLLHLQEHHSRFLREKVTVTSKDVADVFNAERVQGEIRTIVSNNFHGDPLGAVIWTALLVRLRRVPPGMWLDRAAEEVLDQIKQAKDDLGWLSEIDPDQTPAIVDKLQDFKARQLICLEKVVGGDTWRCQMRFPHYLPVLTRDANLDNTLRQHLDVLQDKKREGQNVTSLLPAHDLEGLRGYFHPGKGEPQEPPVRVLVAGGQWPAALQHEYGGLPDRLGLSSQEILSATSSVVVDGPYAVRDASTEYLEALLVRSSSVRPNPPLLLGGLRLLRAALQQEENTNGEVLAFGLHRLTSARLAWWFGRLRTWHFDVPGNAVTRILDLTSGIPLLVRVADDYLCEHVKPGAGVSADLFGELEARLERARTTAERLCDPASDDGLSRREREILQMAVVAARTTAGFPRADVAFSLWKELGEDWEGLYSEELPGVPPLDTTVADQLALRLLRFAGLLPLNQAGQFRARADDALYSLVAAIQAVPA